MKLSHSKLSTILTCPMSYYLSYIEGIQPIETKSALYVGSAVHWGIEHNTEDLTEYFGSENSEYTRDQLLSEAMVHGYLKHKNELFDKILTDKDGSKLELVDEQHELFVTGKLQSFKDKTFMHEFVGIVDLLLLTNKGFIVIDYKTSTFEPNWDNYLEQIYRYVFLLRSEFPDIPIVKIGIINIRKTAIKQKKTENYFQFLNRMKFEYDINDENYVNYHEYEPENLDKEIIDAYINNLAKMCDTAKMIDDNKMWFINYSAANGQYGKSQFWNIFYEIPDCYLLYKISDTIYEDGEIKTNRACVPIDMKVINNSNVMNHYEKYKTEAESYVGDNFEGYLKKKYLCDDTLLNLYKNNYLHKI